MARLGLFLAFIVALGIALAVFLPHIVLALIILSNP